MERRVTAQGIWDDIEFELIQGLPSRDELGESIRAVQRHHDTLRAQVFGEGGRTLDRREIAARQFQINEMLLTLLQETTTALRKVQLDVERISRSRQGGLSAAPPAASSMSAGPSATEDSRRNVPDPIDAEGHGDGRPLTDIEIVMRPDALEVPQYVRPHARLSVAGRIITRVKAAFHRLVHFYVRQLSEKQASVNRVYGEWILYQLRLGERQRDQIVRLGRRLAALDARDTGIDSHRAPEGSHDRPRRS